MGRCKGEAHVRTSQPPGSGKQPSSALTVLCQWQTYCNLLQWAQVNCRALAPCGWQQARVLLTSQP